MSEVILSGIARERGSTATLIRMRVTGNAGLVEVTAGIHAPTAPFSGTYNPTMHAAALLIAQDEFAALKADLAGGAQIAITLTYESVDNSVKRFCFPSTCLPARALQTASRDTVVPTSGVTATDETAATGTGE